MNARLACTLIVALLFARPGLTQSTYGTILGTVKDSSGAAVANVEVPITNTDENSSRTVRTNGSGDYEASNSQPAHYEVRVTAPGFQTFTATGLTLAARQILR